MAKELAPYRTVAVVPEDDWQLVPAPLPSPPLRSRGWKSDVELVAGFVKEAASGRNRFGEFACSVGLADELRFRIVHYYAQCPRCFEGTYDVAGAKAQLPCCGVWVAPQLKVYKLSFSRRQLAADKLRCARIAGRWIDHKMKRLAWQQPFKPADMLQDGWGSCVSRKNQCSK